MELKAEKSTEHVFVFVVSEGEDNFMLTDSWGEIAYYDDKKAISEEALRLLRFVDHYSNHYGLKEERIIEDIVKLNIRALKIENKDHRWNVSSAGRRFNCARIPLSGHRVVNMSVLAVEEVIPWEDLILQKLATI